jgi:hypothetical protein
MKNLSRHTDVFCITNLIAGKEDPYGKDVQIGLTDQYG